MESKELRSTSKKKSKYPGWAYILSRQAYLNSIGEYRCDLKVQGEKERKEQCVKCASYYVNNFNQ